MTGTAETVRFLAACHQRYANRHLACALYANMQKIGYPEYSDEEQHFARALQHALGAPEEGLAPPMTCIDAEAAPFKGSSSDVGDVTLKAPTATLLFPTWVPCAKEHTWPVTACQRSSIAHKGIKAGAEVSGLTVLDLLTKKDLLQAVKDEFEETAAKHPFIPYLPEDAMPPLEWHREEMDAVRSLLEKALAELTRQDNEIKPA